MAEQQDLEEAEDSPLSDKVRMFNTQANKHMKNQSLNPFSQGDVQSMSKPKFSKEEYGRPEKGSKSEARGCKATTHVCKEMQVLCEVINENGELLFTPKEKKDDPRKVISFGELFNLYTIISDKLVGILLRARKYQLLDFEGEVLFQRRDDHVPIIMLKPIEEIRRILQEKIDQATAILKQQGDVL